MVRLTSYRFTGFIVLVLLAAQGSSQKTAQPSKKEQRPPTCEVTARSADGMRELSFVDDGHDTLELKGHGCKLPSQKGRTAISSFLFGSLVLVPGLFALCKHAGTSNYTWVFLDNFVGLFLGIMWWSCFEEQFRELSFPLRVIVFVATRVIVVPFVLFLMADHEHLFGIGSIVKHVLAFMAIGTGTEALKYMNTDGPPSVKLLFVCLVVASINLALWYLKVGFVKRVLADTITARVQDRWEEVTTEVGLDAAAFCLAAMLFLTGNSIYFKKCELFYKEADLSMGNTTLFDQPDEGVFAALYALVMFAWAIVMEYVGGSEDFQVGYGEVEEGHVAMLLRKGRVNQESICSWERVVYLKDLGDGKAMCQLVGQSVLQDPEDGQVDSSIRFAVFMSKLKPAPEDTWEDYVWRFTHLAVVASAAWSSSLALCCLVRLYMWPSLLHRELEGSLAVSFISLLVAGLVIGLLAVVQQEGIFLPIMVTRYLRVYLLRGVSLMAALSWDVTFEHAIEALHLEDPGVGFEGDLADRFVLALIVSGFIAPAFVVGMRPRIAEAVALVEHQEEDLHEHFD